MARIRWLPSYRLVPSRFPPVSLFDRVARAEDLDFVLAAEGLTNDRLRDEVGDLLLVPPDQRVAGPGTTPVMAAFTHLNREGSRFSDGTYGVYYAARDMQTAIAETVYHRARFLARTCEPPGEIDMRTYLADLKADFVDLRGYGRGKPDYMDPDGYAASQAYGLARRAEGANGIAFDSVRHRGGQCVAVFKPKVVGSCRQGPHICYVWDGRGISVWYEKSPTSQVKP